MNPKYCKGVVYSNEEVSSKIFELKLKGDFSGDPGQFYMLRSWDKDPFLSRPISICNIEEDFLTFLYEVRGQGTSLLSKLKKGDYIYLMGPLGTGFPLDEKGKVGIVAGGIGIAPMVYLSKKISNVDFYAGFRELPFYNDKIDKSVDNLYVSTDSGLEGHSGFITDIFNPEKYSLVYTCGPLPMMKKVVQMCIEKNVPIYVSMESRMACGIGACLGCSIETTSGVKRVCKDGPVFMGEEVVFDD